MQQNHANQKIAAFREFATQLTVQVVEQLCTEYEREVSVMYSDLVTYRTELERVAELLGHQLGRERQLHEMLTTMGDVHSSMVAQMEGIVQQSPNVKVVHDMVDALQGQQVSVINSTLSGMSEAQTVASTHAQQASMLKEQTITAEHEFNRIMQLLQTPLIPKQMPAPTMAMVPQLGGGVGAFGGGGMANGAMSPVGGMTAGGGYAAPRNTTPPTSPIPGRMVRTPNGSATAVYANQNGISSPIGSGQPGTLSQGGRQTAFA
eukprot:TRINITY_DN8882_c0_g1_i1.p1 TRINITY_DN8882_c0_g1~~TRINITY_DN8882_c0_g1_i1.p1  ORF type:complete len:262 (+),score=47.80 TRINITY_DN8882_c0_g1_i1:85-870(+)